jgi:uncharacterized RDD family membrane protein YckC
MSAAAETVAPPVRDRTRETIVDFSPYELRAPFALRCGALLIDYIVVVAVPVAALILNVFVFDDSGHIGNSSNTLGWLLAIMVVFSNFFILPLVGGQTVGKMMTGLRIVKLNGASASVSSILIRQSVGYLLTFFSLGAGFLISAFNRSGRALHDYIAGTTVIYGRKIILK